MIIYFHSELKHSKYRLLLLVYSYLLATLALTIFQVRVKLYNWIFHEAREELKTAAICEFEGLISVVRERHSWCLRHGALQRLREALLVSNRTHGVRERDTVTAAMLSRILKGMCLKTIFANHFKTLYHNLLMLSLSGQTWRSKIAAQSQ